jgi:hypothetical protein
MRRLLEGEVARSDGSIATAVGSARRQVNLRAVQDQAAAIVPLLLRLGVILAVVMLGVFGSRLLISPSIVCANVSDCARAVNRHLLILVLLTVAFILATLIVAVSGSLDSINDFLNGSTPWPSLVSYLPSSFAPPISSFASSLSSLASHLSPSSRAISSSVMSALWPSRFVMRNAEAEAAWGIGALSMLAFWDVATGAFLSKEGFPDRFDCLVFAATLVLVAYTSLRIARFVIRSPQ